MPKDNGSKPNARLRFVFVDLDSSDATLVESIRTIVAGLGRPQSASGQNKQTPQVLLPPPNRASATPPTPEAADGVIPVDTEPDGDDDGVAERPAVQPRTSRPRKYQSPKAVSGLNFDDGAKSLKQFLDEKKPKTSVARYACIAAWLKENKNVEYVTIDHVYTAYVYAGYPTSDVRDWSRVFRNSQRKLWFEPGPTANQWHLMTIGEGRVREGKFGADE